MLGLLLALLVPPMFVALTNFHTEGMPLPLLTSVQEAQSQVPIGVFPFCGHKNSFFGDLHCHGKDAFRFYTESKCVTTRWFDEEEKQKKTVDTWDGSAL